MVTDAGLRKKAIFGVAMMTEVRDAGISRKRSLNELSRPLFQTP